MCKIALPSSFPELCVAEEDSSLRDVELEAAATNTGGENRAERKDLKRSSIPAILFHKLVIVALR